MGTIQIRHALKAQSAGVDLIEVVGYEASIAGGQPGDEVGSWVMLAKVKANVTITCSVHRLRWVGRGVVSKVGCRYVGSYCYGC